MHTGARWIRVPAPLDRIPVFVREGAIVPRGDVLKANNCWTADWAPRLRVEVFLSARRASECRYFAGRAQRSITSRPAGGAIVLEVQDLGVETQLDVLCRSPEAVIVNGRPADGQCTYDRERQVLHARVSGATRVTLCGEGGRCDQLSLFPTA